MQPARNRYRSPHAKRHGRATRRERGLALLMTILVLSSLFILGVSLSTAVQADFQEAVFERNYNEAQLRAQEGMATAMGFLMYDVWGVNEAQPFVCSQWQTGGAGDRDSFKHLGDTRIPDAGGNNYAFEYDRQPLLASELELRRVVYPNVPMNRFGSVEHVSLVADWDWVNTNINGGTRVNQNELYGTPQVGRSRYTDAFLPTNSDVNDWFENGLHFNRTDLQGYWRNNFPNRATDLYAGGDVGGWGHDRDGATVDDWTWTDFHGATGYNFPFAAGHALDGDPVVTGPWNFVNTNQMDGDSFTRVFRADLVDADYRNNTYDAMMMGPKITAADGTTYGGAININEVNNNYELEEFPGVVTPNDTTRFPAGSPDYVADNVIDNDAWHADQAEQFYYSGRAYHYNEAKWIYTYDEMGHPTGRYAVTILPDCGQPNVNALGDPLYWSYHGWFPVSSSNPGIFPAFDRGFTLFGTPLYARATYGEANSTAPGGGFAASKTPGYLWREWSDQVGMNRIKNGSLQNIRIPAAIGDAFSGSTTNNVYYPDWGEVDGDSFRATPATNMSAYDAALSSTEFAAGTAALDNPKFAYAGGAQLYAGPNRNVGDLLNFGQGLTGHVFWHILTHGPIRTRAEFMMLLKKKAFMIDDTNYNGMASNGLDENPRGNGVWGDNEDLSVAESDCQFIAGSLTPIGYDYTLDSLWNNDRVIVDSTGDLFMGEDPATKTNAYFWSGLESQSRNAGDPQSGYEGVCPSANLDDDQNLSTPGRAPAPAPNMLWHPFANKFRMVKGKSGAVALLTQLANLHYLGDGLGVHRGGLTPYSPVAYRSDANDAPIGLGPGPESIRRANAAGALSLAYLLSVIHLPNQDMQDNWNEQYRLGEAAGVVVNWQSKNGVWTPDISIWQTMHWRQAWEVSSKAEWDFWHSRATGGNPTYGAFQLHEYMRSTVTEVGRARVYPPYYQNDLDGDGKIGKAFGSSTDQDFRRALVWKTDQRLFLPEYSEIPYDQWMSHNPGYAFDGAGIGLRQTWANHVFTIAGNPTVDPATGISLVGIQPTLMANGQDYLVAIRTTQPLPVKANDAVTLAGAGVFNGAHAVVQVLAPNAFEIAMTKAAIGGSTGNAGGGTVNLHLTDDPHLPAAIRPDLADDGYPEGLPLVMNYIELCWPIARDVVWEHLANNEAGESMSNHTFSSENVPKDFFRMWVTDYDVNNPAGWTNVSDGTYWTIEEAVANAMGSSPTQDKGAVRLDAGYGNAQPFFYVKGRLMQIAPATAGGTGLPAAHPTWYKQDTPGVLGRAGDTKYGVPLLIDMFDQFDPVHFGVSVREADDSGNLQWVNYNTTEFEQRAVQRVFGRLVDMTWGIGRDRIPVGNNGIDEGYRWTTRTGNRGMFIRATTPMVNQRGILLNTPNWENAAGAKAFPFENFSIDMPVTLAMRQSVEKHTRMYGQNGPTYPYQPGIDTENYSGANCNLGIYLDSFSWSTYSRVYGQDCDWQAFYWWNEDGHVGAPAWAGGPTIGYDTSGRSPILPWDPNCDRSIDGLHDPYRKLRDDIMLYGVHSPTAANAPMQSMTQGHPEQFKVIYFHPYFFPEKIVYGTRSRGDPQIYTNQDRYYEYFWPTYTCDAGTDECPRYVVTHLQREKGKVTVTTTNDLTSFLNPGAMGSEPVHGPADLASTLGQYIHLEGCADNSFNGVYQVVAIPGANQIMFQQDAALPDASLPGAALAAGPPFAEPALKSGGTATSQPAGFISRYTPFARIFDGATVMDNLHAKGGPSWAAYMGAPSLASLPVQPAPFDHGDSNPSPGWVHFNNMTTTTWTKTEDAYYPVDRGNWDDDGGAGKAAGSNANAQNPTDMVERVRGVITLPDYLGVGDLPSAKTPTPHTLLWTKGPWWVDGDEGQGPIVMTPLAGLAAGDFILDTTTGARAQVATTTGGANAGNLVLQPCAPYTGGIGDGDSLSVVKYNFGASPFETDTPIGVVANSTGQRLWFDYGRYCNATTNPGGSGGVGDAGMSPIDWSNLDPVPGAGRGMGSGFTNPPASSRNTYLEDVLEFSLSTPWVLDNGPAAMWQYNSAYCFKDNNHLHPDCIWSSGAATRIDPAFGDVRWYLAKGTDHECQVFSLPTPGERNTDHVAWGASPDQLDRWGNGIMPDPSRTGSGPANPGFNCNNGMAAGSPISQYVEDKLELALYEIGNPVTDRYMGCTKDLYYCTPIGHESADEVDFHELNWWDLSDSTALDSIWELGVTEGENDSDTASGWGSPPCFQWLGKDPLSLGDNDPGLYPLADSAKGLDIAQQYFTSNSVADYIDNQNRGIREILTQDPLRTIDPSVGRTLGHYCADRETTFKINPNLIASPMLFMWLEGSENGQAQPTYIFGNKPARGYISVPNLIAYCGTAYSDYHLTHWNARIWYKHQMISPSSFNDCFGVEFVDNGYGRLSNMVTFAPAPVYTALITGQTIDDSGNPTAQVRLSVGIERTYDGKCNILEYQINPAGR